jgi:hypothetical protein
MQSRQPERYTQPRGSAISISQVLPSAPICAVCGRPLDSEHMRPENWHRNDERVWCSYQRARAS